MQPKVIRALLLITQVTFNNTILLIFEARLCVCVCVCVCARAQLYPTLCSPMDYSPPSSAVHGISQARILEKVALLSSRGSSQPKDQTHISGISCTGRRTLYQLSHHGSSEQDYNGTKIKKKKNIGMAKTFLNSFPFKSWYKRKLFQEITDCMFSSWNA